MREAAQVPFVARSTLSPCEVLLYGSKQAKKHVGFRPTRGQFPGVDKLSIATTATKKIHLNSSS
jgi:hypothetical protein